MTVILINYTYTYYVANLYIYYQWSSLIRIFFCQNVQLPNHTKYVDKSVTKWFTPLRNCNGVVATEYIDVFDISCQITREQSARNSFRRQHIGEHCPFKLNTSQTFSVEFGYIGLDNPRNGEDVLDDTLVRLRH